MVDDLWLSYVTHQIGWGAWRIPMSGVVALDRTPDETHPGAMKIVQETALWSKIIEVKEQMLKDLRACGWNV